jgi:hypothetical protein
MFVCIGCGQVAKERAAVCPKCGTVMRNERELAHNWVGRPGPNESFALRCRERRQVAYMDYDIANELPYCPFCRKNLEYRPSGAAVAQEPSGALPQPPGLPRKD